MCVCVHIVTSTYTKFKLFSLAILLSAKIIPEMLFQGVSYLGIMITTCQMNTLSSEVVYQILNVGTSLVNMLICTSPTKYS